MNTAYRVWDGKEMHYWNDKGVNLVFQDNGRWSLWQGYGDRCVASSNDGKSVLMWGTEIRDTPVESDIGESIYAGHIVRQENLDPDLCGNSTLIGEVKMIEGSWCIVNEKKEECRLLFSEMAINSIIGDVYQNPELLEGAECQK
ncbi:YopX family protein [Bacillus inaquosorum]|uniref:YopX family protein n=1 Tax=Bacillus inaquosorum TaxID=483913 RepID=UPI00227DC9D1|nr:YopX family protein [Bacillus inaquosorum]MCY8387897.1 YopX family protein [Bacillus inaquosorum]